MLFTKEIIDIAREDLPDVEARLRRTGCLPHPLVGHVESFCDELWVGRAGCDYGIRQMAGDRGRFEVIDADGRVLSGQVALSTAWSMAIGQPRNPGRTEAIALRLAMSRFRDGRGTVDDIEEAALSVPGILSVGVHTDRGARCVLAEFSGRRGSQVWLGRPAPLTENHHQQEEV